MNRKILILITAILIIFINQIAFAQRRIHQLNEMTQPTNDDLLVIVDDPDGTPVEMKVKISNFNNFNNISIDSNSHDPNNAYFQISDKLVICRTFTSAGINACIDALGSEGGEVYLPEGTYACTEEITIDYANTTLRGTGENTILRIDSNNFIGINIMAKDGTLITDLKINGNEGNIDAKNSDYLIYINGASKMRAKISNCIFSDYEIIAVFCAIYHVNGFILIDNCIFKDSEKANSEAIRIEALSGVIISNNTFTDIEHGIRFNTHDGCKVQIVDNWFYSCDDTAIEINEKGALIVGNGFNSNSGMDIDINDYYTTIVGNNSYWNTNIDSVNIDSQFCIFSNNVYQGDRGTYGIEITANYNIITSNIWDDAGTMGIGTAIWLNGADKCTISSNNWMADSYGIKLTGSDNNIIFGNIGAMAGTGSADVYMDANSTGNIIYGNNFQDGMNLNANSGDYEIYGVPNYYGSTSTSGTLKQWTYQNDDIADDGTVNLPDVTSGMIFACVTDPNDTFADASGFWMVSHDGACTLVSGTAGTTAAADTDGDLCVYDGGTYGILKNRMGNVGEIRAFYFYN